MLGRRPGPLGGVGLYLSLDPQARALYRDWADVAEDVVYGLRMNAGQDPDDARLTERIRVAPSPHSFARSSYF